MNRSETSTSLNKAMKWRKKKAVTKKSIIFIIGAVFCCQSLLQPPEETRGENMNISLWLVPPLHVATILEERVSLYSRTSGGPYFYPHVTVIGGITCDSRDHAKQIASLLQEELSGFGEISAVFQPKAQNFDTWNQALVYEMDASPKFVRLCQRARGLLRMEKKNLFPPPISAPHLSLFYGVENVPKAEEVEPVPNFTSKTLALWITYPTNVQGVPQWEFLDEISLA